MRTVTTKGWLLSRLISDVLTCGFSPMRSRCCQGRVSKTAMSNDERTRGQRLAMPWIGVAERDVVESKELRWAEDGTWWQNFPRQGLCRSKTQLQSAQCHKPRTLADAKIELGEKKVASYLSCAVLSTWNSHNVQKIRLAIAAILRSH